MRVVQCWRLLREDGSLHSTLVKHEWYRIDTGPGKGATGTLHGVVEAHDHPSCENMAVLSLSTGLVYVKVADISECG